MESETTPTTAPESTNRKKLWIWIIGIVAILAIIGAVTKKDSSSANETGLVADLGPTASESGATSTQNEESGEVEDTPDDVSETGLGLYTEDVRAVFARHGMSTELGKPVDGMDNWSGQTQHVIGQILADGDKVEAVQLVILFDVTDPSSLKADAAGRILSELDPTSSSAAQKLLVGRDFTSNWTDAIVVSRGVLRGVYTLGEGNIASLVLALES